jgi:hypothetical protein
MDEDYIILWGPKSGKSLKRAYKELAEEPAFKDLPDDELHFVWLYAIKNGPIDSDESDTFRASCAAPIAFKKNPDKIKKFSSLIFDEPVKKAIERMKKYSPLARAIAKRVAQDTINNYKKMVKVDLDSFNYIDKDGNAQTDWSGRNQYVMATAKINAEMPDLVKVIEDGYGVEEKDNGGTFKGKSAIDVFHKQNSE